MDWQEAQALVLAGQADALLQMNRTPDREGIYSFSDPLRPAEFVIIKRKDAADIHEAADLEGKRVAVELGGYAYDLLSGLARVNRRLQTANAALEAVHTGSADSDS